MKKEPITVIWVVSFIIAALFVESLNIIFALSFIVFAICSIYIAKHSDILLEEKGDSK